MVILAPQASVPAALELMCAADGPAGVGGELCRTRSHAKDMVFCP